jgi:predicted PurR-regulated permease PerM
MQPSRKVTVEVTNKTIVRTILWIVASVLFFNFLGHISHVITLIFAAFFLALALNPIVSWARHQLKIKSRAQATAVAYLIVVAFLTIFFVLVTPPLVRQTREFISDIPNNVQQFQNQDSALTRAVQTYHLDKKLNQAAKDFASNYGDFGGKILDTGKRIAEALASFFAVLVMAIYFVIYFFIENHTFQPYVQSRLNDLTPLMVFVAAIIGVAFGGILGAIVAIPTASAIKILAEDYYERRNNHPPQINKEAI